MFLLIAVLVGVATAPLTGGRIGRLAGAPLRLPLSPVIAALLQAVIATSAGVPPAVLAAAHVGSYLVAGVFVMANRHCVGVWLLGLGGALNGVAIIVNGGVMPASAGAVARAGVVHEFGRFHNSAVLDSPRLGLLGDVFALPASWPASNVFSLGDGVLFAAAIFIIHELAGSPWTTRLWGPRSARTDLGSPHRSTARWTGS